MGLLSLFKKHRSGLPVPVEPDALRGFTNFGVYVIHGINPKTGRGNKREGRGLDADDARSRALSSGLDDPVVVEEKARLRASRDQLAALARIGYKGPLALLTNVDAAALLSFEEDGDRRRITQAEWDAACVAGFDLSALTGPTLYKRIMKTGDWHHYDD